MKVVILCGGQGTRLREETEFRPKPLVDIGGKPILWHIMKTYAHHGFLDFILCLGYRGNMIKDYFLNYEAMNNDFTICLGQRHQIQFHGAHTEQNFRVTLVDTGMNTMTGGRLQRIRNYLEDQPFMVTYGDGLSDVNLRNVLNFHNQHGKIATVTSVRPISRYGSLQFAPEGRVTHFNEKPVSDSWINAGFFIFDKQIFEYLDGDQCVLEKGPLEDLARTGSLMAYRHDGFFFAMDTYREYSLLNEMWAKGEAPWRVWE